MQSRAHQELMTELRKASHLPTFFFTPLCMETRTCQACSQLSVWTHGGYPDSGPHTCDMSAHPLTLHSCVHHDPLTHALPAHAPSAHTRMCTHPTHVLVSPSLPYTFTCATMLTPLLNICSYTQAQTHPLVPLTCSHTPRPPMIHEGCELSCTQFTPLLSWFTGTHSNTL